MLKDIFFYHYCGLYIFFFFIFFRTISQQQGRIAQKTLFLYHFSFFYLLLFIYLLVHFLAESKMWLFTTYIRLYLSLVISNFLVLLDVVNIQFRCFTQPAWMAVTCNQYPCLCRDFEMKISIFFTKFTLIMSLRRIFLNFPPSLKDLGLHSW